MRKMLLFFWLACYLNPVADMNDVRNGSLGCKGEVSEKLKQLAYALQFGMNNKVKISPTIVDLD